MQQSSRSAPPPPLPPPPAYTAYDRYRTDSATTTPPHTPLPTVPAQYALYMLYQQAGPSATASQAPSAGLTTSTSASAALPSMSATHSITHIYVLDVRLRRWTFVVRIPKKREGWKADLLSISEKGREEARYEVRREPLARKYDFRPPNGMHNVMMPHSAFSTSSSKSFSIEAPDGQKLVWKRKGGSSHTANLLSQPSLASVAQYHAYDHRSGAPLPASVTLTSAVPCASEPARLQGFLHIVPFDDNVPAGAEARRPVPLQRHSSQSSAHSTSSTSSSEGKGPRLCFGANRRVDIGLFAPAVVAAGFGAPHCAAAMNRRCIIGDDLANLGRVTVSAARSRGITIGDEQQGQTHERSMSGQHDSLAAEHAAQAEHWAALNRMTSVRKNNDPRPRAVDVDLVLASLMAVLAT